MIIGVIDGYYRSGTTLIQRLCSKSNPDYVVLCEPTQHEIIDHIIKNGCDNYNSLHGWEIFKDYCKLPKKTLHTFIKRHFEIFDSDRKQWGIMTSEGAVRYLLQPLHDCELPIVIKSTQLHLFLDKLKEWYDCWVLYVDRNIHNIIADHYPYYLLTKTMVVKEYLLSSDGVLPFYGDLVYENLTRYLNVDKDIAKKNIDKLVFNILVSKKIATNQKGVAILNFNEFVENPITQLSKIPFKVEKSLLRIVDPKKGNPTPNWLREIVNISINNLRDFLETIRW